MIIISEITNGLQDPLTRKSALRDGINAVGNFFVTFNTEGATDTEQTEKNILLAAENDFRLPEACKKTSFRAETLLNSWPKKVVMNPLSYQRTPLQNGIDLDLDANYSNWSNKELRLLNFIWAETDLLNGLRKKFGGTAAKATFATWIEAKKPLKAMLRTINETSFGDDFIAEFDARLTPGHPSGELPRFLDISWPNKSQGESAGVIKINLLAPKESIRDLLEQNKIREAVELLKLQTTRSSHREECTSLLGRLKRVETKSRQGLITTEKEGVQYNILREAASSLMKEILR